MCMCVCEVQFYEAVMTSAAMLNTGSLRNTPELPYKYGHHNALFSLTIATVYMHTLQPIIWIARQDKSV